MEKTICVIHSKKDIKKVAIDPNHRNDPFFRYKMPQLNIQVIGKNKMVRTQFLNIDDVSKALGIPATYIPHYIAKTIGTQTKNDPNKKQTYISGEYSLDVLEKLILQFIKEFVLCRQCELPELIYSPRKKNCRVKCQSCGWRTSFRKMESQRSNINAKFWKWAINNPPPKSKEYESLRDSAEKIQSKLKSKDWSVDTSEEARRQRVKDQVPGSMRKLIIL